MVVEGNGTSLASHYMCLILLQISIPFPESAPIPSSCGLYCFQYGIRQFSSTEALTFLPQTASFFGEKVWEWEKETVKRKIRINLNIISILSRISPSKLLPMETNKFGVRVDTSVEHNRKHLKIQGSRG